MEGEILKCRIFATLTIKVHNFLITLVLMKLTYGIVEFVVINVVIGYDVPLRLCKTKGIKIINKNASNIKIRKKKTVQKLCKYTLL